MALVSSGPPRPGAERTLGWLAEVVALGVRRQRSEARARRDAELVETLHHLGTDIVAARDLETVSRTVVDGVTRLTGAQDGVFLARPDPGRAAGFAVVARGGEPGGLLDTVLTDAHRVLGATLTESEVVRIDDVSLDARFAGLGTPLRSYLAVPVVPRSGEVDGALVLGHEWPGVFGEREEEMALGIAGQAALAFDGARLADIEHRQAVAFQRALLPPDLPRVPGLELAARYVPASAHALVGGDWYDVVVLPGGRLAFTVGDVTGHDMGAAVTMGRYRSAVRTYALEGHPPASALARVDWLLGRDGEAGMATVIHGEWDARTRMLTWCRAGHQPLLLHAPGGEMEWLDRPAGMPLGAGLAGSWIEESRPLVPGTTVVACTDGLLERRDAALTASMALLEASVAEAAHLPVDELCDRILDDLTGPAPADDVALLVLRVTPDATPPPH